MVVLQSRGQNSNPSWNCIKPWSQSATYPSRSGFPHGFWNTLKWKNYEDSDFLSSIFLRKCFVLDEEGHCFCPKAYVAVRSYISFIFSLDNNRIIICYCKAMYAHKVAPDYHMYSGSIHVHIQSLLHHCSRPTLACWEVKKPLWVLLFTTTKNCDASNGLKPIFSLHNSRLNWAGIQRVGQLM